MRDLDLNLDRNKKSDKEIIQLSKEAKKEEKRLSTIADAIEDARKKVEQLLSKYPCLIIRDEKTLVDYIDATIKRMETAVDTETTGLNVYKDKLVGISIYTKGQTEAYIPLNHIDYRTGDKIPNQLPIEIIQREFARLKDVQMNMHHSNFDIRVLNKEKVPSHCTWDVLIMAHLLDENEDHGLKPLHQKYILKNASDEYSANKIFDLKTLTFAEIPIEIAAPYAAHDAKITQEMKDYQYNVFRTSPELKQLWGVFQNIEMPLVPLTVEMEDTGFVFDYNWHNHISPIYHNALQEEEKKVYIEIAKFQSKIDKWRKTPEALNKPIKKNPDGTDKWIPEQYTKKGTLKKNTGCYAYGKSLNEQLETPIKISSPTQIAILLYDILKIKPPNKDKPRSTGEAELRAINNDFTNSLLAYKKFSKLVDAFVDSLPNEVVDGIIHYNLNQCGTKTGRWSCIAKGTNVSTSSGNIKIENIKIGTRVYCYSKDGLLSYSIVTNVFDNGIRDCIKLKWKNTVGLVGELICTPDHFIFTNNGWKMAKDLTIKDRLYHFNYENRYFANNYPEVEYTVYSITSAGKHQVYDLEVKDTHNFIANDICVHNCSSPNIQQIPAGNDDIRKLFTAPTCNREVELKSNTIYTFKDTEEIEINGNWVFVKDLKQNDKIDTFTVYKTERDGNNIKVYVI